MARNGSGEYSLPANTAAVSGATISSTKFNSITSDIESVLNTARPVVKGGTGATTASAARTNLGLAIGSDVQAYDAGLASIAGLTTAANKMIYTTAADTYAVADLSAFARTLLDDADASAMRTTLGVGTGDGDLLSTNNLSDLASATTARSNLGLGSAATQATSAFLQPSNNLSDVSSAATARTNLGLGSLSTLSSINNGNWSGADLAVANGGTGASDAATARSNLAAYGSGDNASFGTLTASGDVNVDSGTFFVDVSTNRVGIGQTSPDAKLDVDGGIKGQADYSTASGTLVAADHYKGTILNLTGTVTFANADGSGDHGVMVAGSTAKTINDGTTTMYVNGSAVTSATLAARGVASFIFIGSSNVYLSGDVS